MAGCFCDKCGADFEEDDIFCRECGERVDKPVLSSDVAAEEAEPAEEADEPPGFRAPAAKAAFCRNCGAPLEKDGSFCWECGMRVGETVADETMDDEPSEEPPVAPLPWTATDDDEDAGDAAEQAEPAIEPRICGNCGAPLAEDDVLCPACGTWVVSPAGERADENLEAEEIHLSERICGNCGAFLIEGDVFCPACGVRAVFRDEPAASPEEIDEPDEPDEPPPAASEDDGVPAPRPSRVKQNKRNVLRDAAVFLLAGALTVSIVIACFRYLPNLQQTQANETAPSRPESDRVEEADGAVFAASEDQPDQPKSAEISSLGELEFEPRSADSPEYDYIVPSDDPPRDLPSMLGVSEDIAEDYADPDPYPGLVTGAEFEVIASPGAAQFRKR